MYVANDFLSNDLLYINNQDGTFTNRARDMFKHFSLSSMGSDIADIDNNGSLELYTTEMQPYYNKEKSSFKVQVVTKRNFYQKIRLRKAIHSQYLANKPWYKSRNRPPHFW
ncbi:FG-GAP-like repeat-containing protein [Winogradskyella maritima]|nr:FG-GAP-like repeat-containing protein [Winogradskyella maritima]